MIGWLTVEPVLFGDYFGGAIQVLPAQRRARAHRRGISRAAARSSWSAFTALPLWLAAAGVLAAWLFFYKKPALADAAERALQVAAHHSGQQVRLRLVQRARHRAGARGSGRGLWQWRRSALIDGALVNGSARMVGWLGVGDALRAVRLPVSLRLRDDPRAGLAAAVAALAAVMLERHTCSRLLIWLPIVGGVAVLALGERAPRPRAGCRSLVVGARRSLLSVPLCTGLQDAAPRRCSSSSARPGFRRFTLDFHLGVDGISMPLILLTTFTTVLVVIAGWGSVEKRVAQYFAAFLILEG